MPFLPNLLIKTDPSKTFSLVMMMNCFCRMVDRRKAFSLISSRDHCQRSSPSRISDTPRAGFEPAQDLSSGLVEWSCTVAITTGPQGYSSYIRSRNSMWKIKFQATLVQTLWWGIFYQLKIDLNLAEGISVIYFSRC